MTISCRLAPDRCMPPISSASFAAAASVAGTASRNVNRAAASRRSPKQHADRDGRARAGHARNRARWPGRIQSATHRARSRCLRRAAGRRIAPRRTSATAPMASATAATAGVRSECSMTSLKIRPTTTTGRVPTTMRCASRAGRVGPRATRGGNRPHHSADVGRKNTQDRGQRAHVQRDVEGQAEVVRDLPAEERPGEDQVRRARDRQELGESLHDPEDDCGDGRSRR